MEEENIKQSNKRNGVNPENSNRACNVIKFKFTNRSLGSTVYKQEIKSINNDNGYKEKQYDDSSKFVQ